MDQQTEDLRPYAAQYQGSYPYYPQEAPKPPYPVTGRDRLFSVLIFLFAIAVANAFLYGGMNAALGITTAGIMVYTGFQVRKTGDSGWFGPVCIGLSACIALSFLHGSRNGLKLLLLMLCFGGYHVGLTAMTGQQLRDGGGTGLVLDAFRGMIRFGYGCMPRTLGSLKQARRSTQRGNTGLFSVMMGVLIAVPLVVVLLSLLISADAAFAGLLKFLPEFRFSELLATLLLGGILWFPLVSKGISLRYEEPAAKRTGKAPKLAPLTVNTVLTAVCVVYAVYLVAQLAYFTNAFVGLLPRDFTAAEYARRGFFEMVWICAINLGILSYPVLCARRGSRPGTFSLILCLFIAGINLFLVGSALSKMMLYIGSYGLTFLRVTTSLFMIWMALATVLAGISLFRRFGYMRTLVLAALVIAAVVSWSGLDSQVARYNVEEYLSGGLPAVDVEYLDSLGSAAVPYLAELLDCSDPEVVDDAREALFQSACACGLTDDQDFSGSFHRDWRRWNLTHARAEAVLTELNEQGVFEGMKAFRWF